MTHRICDTRDALLPIHKRLFRFVMTYRSTQDAVVDKKLNRKTLVQIKLSFDLNKHTTEQSYLDNGGAFIKVKAAKKKKKLHQKFFALII